MPFQDVLAVLILLSAASYFALGARLLLAKREVGTVPIAMLFLLIGVWVLGGAVELLANSFLVFSVGRTGHFVGTALLPVVAYFAFREYTGRKTSLHRLVILLIIPLVSVALAASNASHEFMWKLPATNSSGEWLTRPREWGTWFLFVHAPYSYALISAAILTLLTHTSAVARSHRRGLLLLVAACFGPLAATVAYDLGFGSDTVSLVPVVFTIMLPLYAWLILAEQLVEFTPLAYETVFQNMQDPVIVVDDDGRIIGLNHGAEDLLEVSETGALLEPLKRFLGDESSDVFAALETGKPHKMMTATGRFLHVQASPITAERGQLQRGRVLMFRDVSDVEKAQAEVRASEKMLRTLIDHSVNGIVRLRWIDDGGAEPRELRCIFANSAAERFLGAASGELVGQPARAIVERASNDFSAGRRQDQVARFLDAMRAERGLDFEVRHRSAGEIRWLQMIGEPFGQDVALTVVDITDGKAREQQMESIAETDPLTGILNRRGFERSATARLLESPDEASGALLFIDLNGFKQINDGCGHEAGDQLLVIAARRLQKSLRSCDIIGRPGGDEFVALVPDVSATEADELARRLTASLEEPYRIGSEDLSCAASIGLALYPEHAKTLTGLLRAADQAMYRAKERSREATPLRSVDLLEKAM